MVLGGRGAEGGGPYRRTVDYRSVEEGDSAERSCFRPADHNCRAEQNGRRELVR